MMINRLTLFASITLCALLLTACSLPGLSPDSKPQPTARIDVTIYATTAPIATPVPAQSPTPVPTVAPTAVPTTAPSAPSDCPPMALRPAAPVKPATFTDTASSVVSVLNAGATSTETLELLKGWGVIFNLPGVGGQQQQQGGIVRAHLLLATIQIDANHQAQANDEIHMYLELEPTGPFADEAKALLKR